MQVLDHPVFTFRYAFLLESNCFMDMMEKQFIIIYCIDFLIMNLVGSIPHGRIWRVPKCTILYKLVDMIWCHRKICPTYTALQKLVDMIWRHGIKVEMYRSFKDNMMIESYVTHKNGKEQVPLTKLRISDHKLMIEGGRHCHPKIPREKGICQMYTQAAKNNSSSGCDRWSKGSLVRRVVVPKVCYTNVVQLVNGVLQCL